MEFDYSKLRGKIAEKFRTQSRFAKEMGMSDRMMSLKLNNRVYFRQDEMFRAAQLLAFPVEDMYLYFFALKVKEL